MTVAVIRNRCFNNRLKQTPYYIITGRKPNLSKMNIFGSTCYAYKNLKKKLDPKCEKGIFVGYDRNSPAYSIFYPENSRVLKHRLIKFISNVTNQQTQTNSTDDDDDDDYFPQRKYVQNNTSATNSDPCLVGWGCRIHRLLLCRGYDTKQSDCEVPAVLELWGMWSTPSLPSLPGPLWPGVVAPDRALSMG